MLGHAVEMFLRRANHFPGITLRYINLVYLRHVESNSNPLVLTAYLP